MNPWENLGTEQESSDHLAKSPISKFAHFPRFSFKFQSGKFIEVCEVWIIIPGLEYNIFRATEVEILLHFSALRESHPLDAALLQLAVTVRSREMENLTGLDGLSEKGIDVQVRCWMVQHSN